MIIGNRARPAPTGDPAPARPFRAFLLVVSGIAGFLALINLSPLIDRYTFARLFDVNGEATLAAWFSSALLLGAAVLTGLAALDSRLAGDSKLHRRTWGALSLVFLLLSADEAASLHELAGEKASRFLEIEALPSLYAWVVVVAPLALVLAIWMARWFARTIGARTRAGKQVLAALGLWVLVPALEALDPSLGGPRILVVVEEALEMAGEILMLAGLLGYLMSRPLGGLLDPAAGAQARDSAGSKSERGASPQSRSRS